MLHCLANERLEEVLSCWDRAAGAKANWSDWKTANQWLHFSVDTLPDSILSSVSLFHPLSASLPPSTLHSHRSLVTPPLLFFLITPNEEGPGRNFSRQGLSQSENGLWLPAAEEEEGKRQKRWRREKKRTERKNERTKTRTGKARRRPRATPCRSITNLKALNICAARGVIKRTPASNQRWEQLLNSEQCKLGERELR